MEYQMTYKMTLAMLKHELKDKSYGELAEESGFSKHWLEKVNQQKIKQPGGILLEKLYKYLRYGKQAENQSNEV